MVLRKKNSDFLVRTFGLNFVFFFLINGSAEISQKFRLQSAQKLLQSAWILIFVLQVVLMKTLSVKWGKKSHHFSDIFKLKKIIKKHTKFCYSC